MRSMNLYALDLPDSPTELALWLEAHVLGGHLGELVAELSVLVGPTEAAAALEDVLKPAVMRRVLEQGLRSLPEDRLHDLMRQPHLLLDLQERVFAESGP